MLSVAFDRVIISCPKSVLSTHYRDEMKKPSKFGAFPPTSQFYNILTNVLSNLKILS